MTTGKSSATAQAADGRTESSKLISLLALATGAVAMPQTSNADVVFDDFNNTPVTVGANSGAAFTIDLPGTNDFHFQARTVPTFVTSSRFVIAGGNLGGIAVKTYGTVNRSALIVPASKSLLWGQINGVPYQTGFVGAANYFGHLPNSYANKYIAFTFKDSTAGLATRYGWIEVSLANPANNNGPDVTILRYAYDDSGAQLAMGAIPEPSSTGMAVLGALTLGAAGIRSWRRKRSETGS
jgi:hypothetical protein